MEKLIQNFDNFKIHHEPNELFVNDIYKIKENIITYYNINKKLDIDIYKLLIEYTYDWQEIYNISSEDYEWFINNKIIFFNIILHDITETHTLELYNIINNIYIELCNLFNMHIIDNM